MTENKITRRSFVERSLFAGAAMALPTHRVLGANSDVRVAIIGCGGKGTSHLRDFATKPGVRIVGISDPDKAHMNSAENHLKKHTGQAGRQRRCPLQAASGFSSYPGSAGRGRRRNSNP